MSEDDYTIDKLIEIFAKHHESYILERIKTAKMVESGEIEFHDWMKDTFSISLALHNICKELKILKKITEVPNE